MKKQTMGDRLRLLRTTYRLSQAKFASAVKLSGVAISNMETGVALNPYPSTLESIAKKFGTTHEWLTEGKGDMLPNGMVDLDEKSEVTTDPWKDALVTQLKSEADAWKQKYEQAWNRLEFLMDRLPLGKLKPASETAYLRTGTYE
jgi:transcriptional regulator with XRE-family HTH domain